MAASPLLLRHLYNDYPAITAGAFGDYYQVSAWDTAAGAMASQALLVFDAPGLKNFEGYPSPVAEIYFLDTPYMGTATVAGNITASGKHTGDGNFSLQGTVASAYSLDSVPFSATISFTNAPD